MRNKQHSDSHPSSTTHWLPLGMSIGISIGMAIGSLAGNIPTGMCIGLGLGMAIGGFIDHAQQRNTAPSQPTDPSKSEE